MKKALAREPDERYPTCGALIVAAEEALGLRERPTVRRRTVLLVVAATIAVALAALAVALVTRENGAKTVPIVRDNFSLVAIGIVIVSILPMVFEFLKYRRRDAQSL